MDTNFFRGKLVRWNDGKGFGFIESDNVKGDIFIHISAVSRMSRRPVVGDVIHYQVHTDNDGKKRAVNAKIQGVSEAQSNVKRKVAKIKSGSGLLSKIVAIIFLMFVGSVIYNKLAERFTFSEIPEVINSAPVKQPSYSCSGKVYCSEMTSCEEAKFYLNNCPGTKVDGDGDGIPCESQWCSW